MKVAIIGGGHVVDCALKLQDRITVLFTDAVPESEYTAMRVPMETDAIGDLPDVRVPDVVFGAPDVDSRQSPILPCIVVRPTLVKSSGDARSVQMDVVIGVSDQNGPDMAYAWNISERIAQDLCKRPYLDDGLYSIDAENIETVENVKLGESWGAYILDMTVPVILPAFLQTEGADGKPLAWENSYGSD